MTSLYYIANYRLPTERAHGLQVVSMCAAFAAIGLDVTLVAPRRVTFKQTIFEYYGMPEHFKISFVPTIDLTGKIPLVGFWIQSISFAIAAAAYIRTQGYHDALYTRDQFSLFLLSLILPNPIVYEIHSMPRMVGPLHRFTWHRAAHIIAISEGVRNALIQQQVPIAKVSVAPDAYDDRLFPARINSLTAREQLGLPREKKIVLYTGSLNAQKGVYTLLDAATLLNDDYVVVLVGGTDTESKTVSEYMTAKKIPYVRLVPRVAHAKINMYLAAADILVIPNTAHDRIASEYTSPLKLFEYLATNKPIIASDVPALREAAGNASGVTFIAPDDATALMSAIQHSDANQTYSRDMRDKTWQARAARIQKTIDQNLDGTV